MFWQNKFTTKEVQIIDLWLRIQSTEKKIREAKLNAEYGSLMLLNSKLKYLRRQYDLLINPSDDK